LQRPGISVDNPPRRPVGANLIKENAMPKGQQKSNKESKKPKKDTSPPRLVPTDAPKPTVTTVVPVRGKLKNK
jgi:hypothetical protein